MLCCAMNCAGYAGLGGKAMVLGLDNVKSVISTFYITRASTRFAALARHKPERPMPSLINSAALLSTAAKTRRSRRWGST